MEEGEEEEGKDSAGRDKKEKERGRWERSLGVKLARRGSCQGGGGGCEGVEEEGEKLGGD